MRCRRVFLHLIQYLLLVVAVGLAYRMTTPTQIWQNKTSVMSRIHNSLYHAMYRLGIVEPQPDQAEVSPPVVAVILVPHDRVTGEGGGVAARPPEAPHEEGEGNYINPGPFYWTSISWSPTVWLNGLWNNTIPNSFTNASMPFRVFSSTLNSLSTAFWLAGRWLADSNLTEQSQSVLEYLESTATPPQLITRSYRWLEEMSQKSLSLVRNFMTECMHVPHTLMRLMLSDIPTLIASVWHSTVNAFEEALRHSSVVTVPITLLLTIFLRCAAIVRFILDILLSIVLWACRM